MFEKIMYSRWENEKKNFQKYSKFMEKKFKIF